MSKSDVAAVLWVVLTAVIAYLIYGGMEHSGTLALVLAVIAGAVIAGGVVGAALLGLDVERKLRD